MATKIPMAVFLAMAIFFVVPIGFLVYGSLVPNFKSYNFTLSFVITALSSPVTIPLLLTTLEYGIGSAVMSVTIATIYAWLVQRTDIPGKSLLKFLPILPLTVPFIVKAFGWIFLFSPQIGLANLFFENLFGAQFVPFNIFSLWGMIFATGIGGIPLAYLMIEAALQSMDPALEESSQVCGGRTLTTFVKVTLPILRPTLVTAFLLEVIVGVELFEYAFVLGTRVYIQTLATWVYNLMNVTQEYSLAAAYSLIYLLITIVLITFYLRSVRGSYRFVVVTGKASVPTRFSLKGWRWVGFAFCLSIMFIGFILPMVVIALVSLVPFYTVAPGLNPFASLTLDNYVQAFKLPLFQDALVNSFELSIATSLLTTFLATIMAYALLRTKSRFKGILDYFSALPLAFPGVVYGIGLIWTFLVLPGLNVLYGTNWIMLIALVIVWIPYSIRFISNNLVQIAGELEEAAEVSGSKWARTFTRVVVPLLKGGVVNSIIYVFVDSFRELGAVILLSTSSSVLLTVLILDLFESNAAKLPVVAALSTVMTLILAASILAIRMVSRQKLAMA